MTRFCTRCKRLFVAATNYSQCPLCGCVNDCREAKR
jgi:hypothetical protein